MELINFTNFTIISTLSIFFFNICIYIYSTIIIFLILFSFNFKKIDTLSNLKLITLSKYFLFHLLIAFMTLAGLPPLLGFFSKLLIFNSLLCNGYFYIIIFFCFFNFFSIYFYVQNFRFIINNNSKSLKPFKNNFFFYFLLNCFFFFNFFSFFFIDTFIIYINLIFYSLLI